MFEVRDRDTGKRGVAQRSDSSGAWRTLDDRHLANHLVAAHHPDHLGALAGPTAADLQPPGQYEVGGIGLIALFEQRRACDEINPISHLEQFRNEIRCGGTEHLDHHFGHVDTVQSLPCQFGDSRRLFRVGTEPPDEVVRLDLDHLDGGASGSRPQRGRPFQAGERGHLADETSSGGTTNEGFGPINGDTRIECSLQDQVHERGQVALANEHLTGEELPTTAQSTEVVHDPRLQHGLVPGGFVRVIHSQPALRGGLRASARPFDDQH